MAIAAFASAGAMTALAALGWKLVTFVPAALFAALIIRDAALINRRQWSRHTAESHGFGAKVSALADTSRLSGLVFVWGALALFAIYLGTDVRWQHGWQYASAMTLLAAAHFAYARALAAPGARFAVPETLHTTAKLALLQAVAIIAALIWLVASGKLGTEKGDWAANHVFLAGGFAIAALSFAFAKTGRAIKKEI
jgi:hypothetical protein